VTHVFLHLVGEAGTVTVEKVQKSEQRRTKPTAMNTVEMLKEVSKVLGIAPAQTMAIAERLYLRGYLSYPRYVALYAACHFKCASHAYTQAFILFFNPYARTAPSPLPTPKELTCEARWPCRLPIPSRATTSRACWGREWRGLGQGWTQGTIRPLPLSALWIQW